MVSLQDLPCLPRLCCSNFSRCLSDGFPSCYFIHSNCEGSPSFLKIPLSYRKYLSYMSVGLCLLMSDSRRPIIKFWDQYWFLLVSFARPSIFIAKSIQHFFFYGTRFIYVIQTHWVNLDVRVFISESFLIFSFNFDVRLIFSFFVNTICNW